MGGITVQEVLLFLILLMELQETSVQLGITVLSVEVSLFLVLAGSIVQELVCRLLQETAQTGIIAYH